MQFNLFLLLFFFVNFAYAFDEGDLESLHEQLNAGQRVYAVGFNLQDADLKGINFKGADFSNANLRGVNFSGSNLSQASFNHADLSKANFQNGKLTKSDLTDANVNGAKFKKARLLGIKYYSIRSAKGTLFEDKQELLKRIAHEEKLLKIKEELVRGNIQSICIEKPLPLRSIHEHLHEELNNLCKGEKEYTILDFRPLNLYNGNLEEFEHSSLKENKVAVVQLCLEFLQAPFFSASVEKVIPICDHQALIVFLRNDNAILHKKKSYHKSLDLHGKIPLDVKYKWIDHFIKKSYQNQTYAVEIITGRGLHNPQGKMGILWNSCRQYLLSKKFEPYIQQIHSINKQGGWKIILRSAQQSRKAKGKKRNTHTTSYYGSNAPFKNPKLSMIPAPGNKIKPTVSKSSGKSKKSKTSKHPSNFIIETYTEITLENRISLECKQDNTKGTREISAQMHVKKKIRECFLNCVSFDRSENITLKKGLTDSKREINRQL